MYRILLLVLIAAVSAASFTAACSANRRGGGAFSGVTLSDSAVPAGTAYAGERELISAAIESRRFPLEAVYFDKFYNVTGKPGGVSIGIASRKSGFDVTAECGNDTKELFVAFAFDASRFSFTGAESSAENAVTLAIHPTPGVVVAGIAAIQDSTEPARISLSFEHGASLPNRAALKAPKGSQNQVDDLTAGSDGGGWLLEWTEKNVGDYDNNGLVAIPDITPIALNYAATVNHSDPEDEAAIVDGDFSGEIGVSDITPIAINYLNQVAGYNVHRFEAGGDGWELLGVEERQSPDPVWRRLAYDYLDGDTVSADTFYAVVPVDESGNAGIASIVVGVPGANEALKPGPPDEPIPPDNNVNLNQGGLKTFSIEPSTQDSYDLVFPNQNASYIIAMMNTGEPSLAAENVIVGFAGSGSVSSLGSIDAPPIQPDAVSESEYKLKEALRRHEEYLLKYGKTPDLLDRKTSDIGDTRNFNIVFADLDPGTIDDVIEARLRAENDKVRIWIDELVDDERMSGELLSEIADDTRDIILAQEEATYGSILDVDEDGVFDILFTPHINALPGRILGLFVSNDIQDSVGSNNADLIYVQVPDMIDGDPPTVIPPGVFDADVPITDVYFENNVRQVIAHEMQHYISFGNRIKIRDMHSTALTPEELWLNEGLSHFTEDFTGYQGMANLTGVQQYLETAYAMPVFWPPQMDGPIVRGGTYLFLRYLFEREGEGAISAILHRDIPAQAFAGVSNVENATGENIDALVQNWLGTMAFIGYSASPPSQYTYNGAAPHPMTGGNSGVEFLAPYTDYRGLNQYLPRPLTVKLGATPLSLSVAPNTAMFVLVTTDGESPRRVSITSGQSGLTGVFVRINDGAITPEAAIGPTPFEFGKIYSGTISSGSESDDYTLLMTDGGTCYLRAVSSIPGGFRPEIRVNGDVYSDVNPLPGVDQKYLLFPALAGLVTISVSGADGQTGEYLLSGEFYAD